MFGFESWMKQSLLGTKGERFIGHGCVRPALPRYVPHPRRAWGTRWGRDPSRSWGEDNHTAKVPTSLLLSFDPSLLLGQISETSKEPTKFKDQIDKSFSIKNASWYIQFIVNTETWWLIWSLLDIWTEIEQKSPLLPEITFPIWVPRNSPCISSYCSELWHWACPEGMKRTDVPSLEHTFLQEDQSSNPSTQMVAHNHL